MHDGEEKPGTPDLSVLNPRTEDILRYIAVGRCSDGVTHDINNFLGAAMAYAELVELEVGLRDEAKRMLREIVNRLQHAATMMGDLTTIARRRFSNPSMVIPVDIVKATLKLRDYAFRVQNTKVQVDIAPDVGAILGDGPKIQLALIYLLLNAEEALATVEQKLVRVYLCDHPDGISISVWDAGEGLSPEAFAEALAPGFTTQRGPNTGLGLTAVQHIATAHGGDLTYTREGGFRLYLRRENDLGALRG